MAYRLGVDIGTTYTAAAVFRAGATEMVGLGNRAMQIPSVLYLKPDGSFLVGEAAEARSTAEPERVVREFKRRIGDPVPLLVAGSPFSAEALTARLLSHVVGVAAERQGEPPEAITVAHPANWGSYKMELLRQAFLLADLRDVQTCTEPEAAAIAYAARQRVEDGASIAVYDLGGGTFDAAVLRNVAGHFTLLGMPEGIEHLGGVDFDEAVFQHVLRSAAIDLRTLNPDDPEQVFALDRLRRDCVVAKEALSTDTEAVVSVPLGSTRTTVRLTRADLEEMLRPPLDETIGAMRRVLRSAEVEPDALSAIVLVGGSSRIPLVSELLVGAFRRPLAMDTHPKHDIALGAARFGVAQEPVAPPPVAPPSAPLPPPDGPPTGPITRPIGGPHDVPPMWPGPEPARPRSKRGALIGTAAVAVVALVLVGIFVWPGTGSSNKHGAAPPRTGSPTAPATTPVATSSTPVAANQRPVGTPLPDNVIVWPKTQNGTTNLWTVASDGSGAHPLIANVPTGVSNGGPVISRDRRTIAYVQIGPGGRQQIHLMSSDGKQDRTLFATPPKKCRIASRPDFLPGDQALLVPCKSQAGAATEDLYLVSIDGTMSGKAVAKGKIGDPSVNKDGTEVVFWRQVAHGHTRLEVAELTGKPDPHFVTEGPNDNDPMFSPVDDSIAFRGGPGVQHIWILRPGAAAPIQLTDGPQTQQDPSWSPNGEQIACKFGPSENADIYVVDVGTGQMTPVIQDDQPDTTPAWSAR
jgi:Tol biopolymer transport system component/actin-like ATPase involved in cell morphogenesis